MHTVTSKKTMRGLWKGVPQRGRNIMKIANAVALIGMVLVSLSTPTDAQDADNVNLSPSLLGTYDTSGFAIGVAVSGNYAYVADDVSGLHILDISTPSSPSLLGTYDTSGNSGGVAVSGNYAYVADDGDGLHIIHSGLSIAVGPVADAQLVSVDESVSHLNTPNDITLTGSVVE